MEGIIQNIQHSISGDTVLTGDLNVDLLNDNSMTRPDDDVTRLEQIVTEATRVTSKSCTLIDHIYTNVRHKDLVGVINSNISDHLPAFMIINKSHNRPQFKEVYGRSFRDFDESLFTADVQNIDYTSVFCSDDSEEVWGLLYSKICTIVDSHFPMKRLRITIGKPK